MNTVLQLGPSQAAKESTAETLNAIYKILPCLDFLPSLVLSPRSPRAHKQPAFHFAGKGHFAVTAALLVFLGCGITGYIQDLGYTLAVQLPTDPPNPPI